MSEEDTARDGTADRERPQTPGESRKDDLIEAAIGVAVLGLGAIVLNGRLGGITRTIARGPGSAGRTPPTVPVPMRHEFPSLRRTPPVV